MNEELVRQRYRVLLHEVARISNSIDSLNGSLDSLTTLLANDFSIDKRGIEEENINRVKNNIRSVRNEINNTILPSISANT